MLNRKQAARDRSRIVEEAKRHVGYRAQPNRQSAYQLKPYLNRAWNGTFVDRVLHDAFGDFVEVRFISTVTALGYYANRNGLYRKPKVGDVVFFNFSTDPARWDEQPHVGIVTEVRPNGSFRTVEGETAPGTPQGSQLVDGVFERIRFSADVLAFVRPRPVSRTPSTAEPARLKTSHLDSNPKTKARAVATVQTALSSLGLGPFNRGKLDGETKSAFGRAARENGTPENRGELRHAELGILADRTRLFELE